MTSEPIMGSNPMHMHIRWLIRRDMASVTRIESESFQFPWDEEIFIKHLRQRNCIGMVVEFEMDVVAYMVYELHKRTINLLNFAVDKDFRRAGLGKAMIGKLENKLSHQRRNRITIMVRETNLPALMFFKNMGFLATGVINAYFDDIEEDGIPMVYTRQPSGEEVWEDVLGLNGERG